jgi:hypothetical protein
MGDDDSIIIRQCEISLYSYLRAIEPLLLKYGQKSSLSKEAYSFG